MFEKIMHLRSLNYFAVFYSHIQYLSATHVLIIWEQYKCDIAVNR